MKVFESLRTRLLLALCIFLTVIIGIVCVLYYSYVSEKSMKDSNKYFVEKTEGISLQINNEIEKMDVISTQILASKTLQEMFVKANEPEYENKNYFEYNVQERATAQDIIWTFNSSKRQIESINVFSKSSYVGPRYSPKVETIQRISGQDIWYTTEDVNYIILGPHIDEWENLEEKNVISLVRPYIATCFRFRNVGTIEVQEKFSKIEDICEPVKTEGFEIIIFDREGNIIYQSAKEIKEPDYYYIEMNGHEAGELFSIQEENVNYIANYSQAENAGWNVLVYQSRNLYMSEKHQLLKSTILFSFLLLFVMVGVFFLLVHLITKPVLRLASDMEQLTDLKDVPKMQESNMREIQILQSSFLRLLQRLNESVNELLLAHETELNLRIMGMQSQINPHFLYNSLTVVSAVAAEEKSQKVPVMCYQLSELFRYSSNPNATVSLKNELDYIAVYLDFMKWRYEDNLTFSMETEGDLSQFEIARLSLQPLVENSFAHGFKAIYPPYELKITCKAEAHGWNFCVSDNGIGFSEEKIHEISEEIAKIDAILLENQEYEELKTKEMAILNIYIRLKLQYKEALYFRITRDQELNGAKVMIVVNYERKV